jgi:hypothetical protein
MGLEVDLVRNQMRQLAHEANLKQTRDNEIEGFESVLITATVVYFLEHMRSADKETWELVVEKARDWLDVSMPRNVHEYLWSSVESIFRAPHTG